MHSLSRTRRINIISYHRAITPESTRASPAGRQVATRFPDALCTRRLPDDRQAWESISWGQMLTSVGKLATLFRNRGVGRGDRIGPSHQNLAYHSCSSSSSLMAHVFQGKFKRT